MGRFLVGFLTEMRLNSQLRNCLVPLFLRNKGTSFASCAFKWEGWLFNLNKLKFLTKKLPWCLSRLNEIWFRVHYGEF